MQVSFRLSDEEAVRFDLYRGPLSRASFAKNRALAAPDGSEDTTVTAAAEELLAFKDAEIASLKRELARRPAASEAEPEEKKPTSAANLPGLSSKKYVCGQCGKLNTRGRCIEHPTAKQKPV